jgi:hypothetical protein
MKTSRNGTKSSTPSRAELIAKRLAGASCSRCVFLVPGHQGAGDFIGECRKSAPAPALITLASERGGVSPAARPVWAMVTATDSCAEFLRRPR